MLCFEVLVAKGSAAKQDCRRRQLARLANPSKREDLTAGGRAKLMWFIDQEVVVGEQRLGTQIRDRMSK